jgi:serine/threonine protein kinase/tetratricopeptide (TPR) repeat protein
MDDEHNPNPSSSQDDIQTRSEETLRTQQASGLEESAAHDDIVVLSRGTRVGQYTIDSLLGVGGMGAVYRAMQQSPHRTVALKLMKPGLITPRAMRRFELESEVLGRLSHPGIASIHEAGVHEGAPFFAMEFVDGPTLTEYVESHELGTRDRLALFAKICDAVQHAHAKGIIHRDLKPHNILVGEIGEPSKPQPKILDFGVARATDTDVQTATMRTDIGQLVGTIPYMSPEQVAADPDDIDTRSDVYALGVVLYELLAGRLPYEIERKLIHEAARIIRYDAPLRLSSINYTLRGDVETIVAKALEKERDRRYQSAHDLGSDIRHYLSDEPIAARPPSAWYQLCKFSRRNKALVGGSSLALVALVLGLVGTSYGFVEANTQRRFAETAATAEAEQRSIAEQRASEAIIAKERAEAAEEYAIRRAEDLRLVSGFQSERLGAVDVRAMGEQLRDSIVSAIPEGEQEAASDLLETVNFTDVALGTLEANIFDETIGVIDEQFANKPLIRSTLLDSVGKTMLKLGFNDRALPPLERALALRRDELGVGDQLTLASLNELSNYLLAQGRGAEAEPYMREALEGIRRIEGDEHQNTITAISNLGMMLMNQGRLDEAEPLIKESAELSIEVLGEQDQSTLISLTNMGELLRRMGRLEEAMPYTQAALDGALATLGDADPLTITLERNMGGLLYTQGKIAEAAPYFERSLDGYRKALGSSHPNTLVATNNLALLRKAQGQDEEAELLWREALTGMRAVLGDAHPETLKVCYNLGALIVGQGRSEEAKPLLQAAFNGYRGGLGPDHPQTLMVMYELSRSLNGTGKHEEARAMSQELVERGDLVHGSETMYTGMFRLTLARACLGLRELSTADEIAQEARDRLTVGVGAENGYTLQSMRLLQEIYTARDAVEPEAGFGEKAEQIQSELDAIAAQQDG